jgi:carboxyl-terminal processing protease
VASYFEAMLYTGTPPDFPADRWSRSESTESFNRFFGDGATLGYGVSVAGLEVRASPAAAVRALRRGRCRRPLQGVQRGDEVLAINGRSAADIIAADDFSLLSPLAAARRSRCACAARAWSAAWC